MGAVLMSELPEGFVIQEQQAPPPSGGLPDGFVVQGGEPAKQERKFGIGDTWPARLAKGVYESVKSGVTLPHDVMTGEANVPGSENAQSIPGAVPFGSPQSSGERIADLTMIGNPASVANGTGRAVAGAVDAARAQAAPSIDALKAAAKAGYDSPEVAGLVIKSPAVSNLSETAQIALNNAGVDEVLAPKTFALLARLKAAPVDSMVTGNNIQTMRRAFGNAAASPDPTERLAATTVIQQLDDFLPNLGKSDIVSGDVGAAAKTLETARANYSAAKHAETIDNKAIQAELRAAAANSGQNVANTVRQRMADILLKPKEQRGFKPEELQMMEEIVRGSTTGNTLRATGNLLGGGGGLGAAVSAGIGGMATAGLGGFGAAAPVIGFALKQLSNKLTLRQTEKLSELIRSNAPLASSMEKFGEKAATFQKVDNPRSRSEAVIAARNLASNLKAAGIVVTAKDLFGQSNKSE